MSNPPKTGKRANAGSAGVRAGLDRRRSGPMRLWRIARLIVRRPRLVRYLARWPRAARGAPSS